MFWDQICGVEILKNSSNRFKDLGEEQEGATSLTLQQEALQGSRSDSVPLIKLSGVSTVEYNIPGQSPTQSCHGSSSDPQEVETRVNFSNCTIQ
jgi:hypothetical protein